jgi:hypothetical protein
VRGREGARGCQGYEKNDGQGVKSLSASAAVVGGGSK